ncbi:MAG: 30S ribosomal protein S16 [Clostridia bacterium]|nr:30S ribosomal protein S16 [Clostridia bacterium]
MAVKMRLTRLGDKKAPFYRVVVIDSHKSRDGQYVDLVGTYDPIKDALNINVEKAKKWISCGVQPTETVKSLLVRSGVVEPKKTKGE